MKKLLLSLLIGLGMIMPSAAGAQVFNNNQISSSTQAVPFFGVIMGDGVGAHKPTASSAPTVGYIVATSTTASSTFGNGINLTKGCFSILGTCVSGAVTSVFSRVGAVVAQAGDYTTDLVTEGTTNLYFTLSRLLSFLTGQTINTSAIVATSSITSYGLINGPNFLATSTTASSTFPNLNSKNSTSTNATSTSLFSTTASATALYLATGVCGGSNALQLNAAGLTICGPVTTGSAASSTLLADQNTFSSASNTIYFLNSQRSTTTQATTTNSYATLSNIITASSSIATTSQLFLPIQSALLKTLSSGLVTNAVSGTDYVNGSGTSGNCVKWGAGNTLTDQGAVCGSGGTTIDFFTHPGANQSATTSLMIFSNGASTTALTIGGWYVSTTTVVCRLPDQCQFPTNGTNDDIAIQNALNSVANTGGGRVLVKTGTYNIATRVKFYNPTTFATYNNITFEGEGPGTIFKPTGADSQTLAGSSTNNTIFRNFTIDGSNQSGSVFNSDMGIKVKNSHNIIIDHVYFAASKGYAIDLISQSLANGGQLNSSTTAVTISNNFFDCRGEQDCIGGGPDQASFGLSTTSNITITGNHIYQTTIPGGTIGSTMDVNCMDLVAVQNLIFTNNDCQGFVVFGSEQMPNQYSMISNNVIDSPAGTVAVAGDIVVITNGSAYPVLSSNLSINGNILRNGKINVTGAGTNINNNILISGNNINTASSTYQNYNGVGLHGIYVDTTNAVNITGNSINANQSISTATGVKVVNSTNVTVSDNTIRNFNGVGGTGVDLGSGSGNTSQFNTFISNTTNEINYTNLLTYVSGRFGIGTTTPGTSLSIGNTGANTINLSTTATSTFGSGLNISTGCFAIGGTCIGGGSGTGASTTLLADNNTFSGLDMFTGASTSFNRLTYTFGTSTGATSTNSFSSIASSTNLFAQIAQFGTLLATGSSTVNAITMGAATSSSATTSALAVTNVISAIMLTNGSGSVGAYGGTTCTNQFIRSLSALGLATCASVANTDLVSSSITINGASVSLGGTITVASTTLLANNNTWTGLNQFTAASTSFNNLTMGNATSSQSTSTVSFFSPNVFGSNGTFNIVTSTSTTATSTFAAAITVGAGQGTSTFGGALSVNTILNVKSTTASSTFANGINLTNGCLSVQGTCITSGSATAIGGTGAIQYANGTAFAGNPKHFWDNTNEWLGVGTSTPWARLSIQGAYGSQAALFEIASSTNGSGAATSTLFRVSADGTVRVGTTSNTTIAASQPARFTIDSGLNTTEEVFNMVANVNDFAEDNLINLNTGTAAQACRTATTNQGSNTTGFITICANNNLFNNPQAYNIGYGGDTSVMGLSTGDMFVVNATAGKKLYFMTGGVSTSTNLSMVLSGNNLGIATTSPYAMLSVAGTGVFQNLVATGTGTLYQSQLQNFTFVNATGSNATSTGSLFSPNIFGSNGVFNVITATSTTATSTIAAALTVGAGQGTSTFGGGVSVTGFIKTLLGITLPDTYTLTTAQQSFGTYDFMATTSDILTLRSFHRAATLREIDAIVDCTNGGCNTGKEGFTLTIYGGSNRGNASTTGTVLLTKNFNSTTTLQTVTSGFTNTAIAANDIIWFRITAASTSQMSIDVTGYVTEN